MFAGMNDHLHAVGLLEQLKGDENPPSRKIWEAIQVLFAAMNEVQENVVSRFGSKDEGGVYHIPWIREYATRPTIRVRGLDPDSRRE